MPSALPLGDPAPPDGLLPAQALEGAAGRAFGLYVHIPFCAVRCGYCDFNTYTATELGGGASQDAYAGTAVAEVDFAAAVLQHANGEVGTIQPLPEAYAVARRAGTPLLCDAQASLGRVDPPRDADVVVGSAASFGGPPAVGFLVVREGTEGPYVGNGGSLRTGTPHEIATEVSVNTRFGVERVVRDAFARARARPRRHLSAGTHRGTENRRPAVRTAAHPAAAGER